MIKYQLTADSAKAFIDSALSDTFRAIDRGHEKECDIFITIGNREIRIPTGGDNFCIIEQAIFDCLQNEEVTA